MNNAPFNVLLADGSGLVATRLKRLIRAIPGIDACAHAQDCAELRRHLSKQHIDAVVIDLFLPGGNLMDELQRLRPAEQRAVIVLGTDVAWTTQQRCISAGATHQFHKSSDFSQALNLLAQLAAQPVERDNAIEL